MGGIAPDQQSGLLLTVLYQHVVYSYRPPVLTRSAGVPPAGSQTDCATLRCGRAARACATGASHGTLSINHSLLEYRPSCICRSWLVVSKQTCLHSSRTLASPGLFVNRKGRLFPP